MTNIIKTLAAVFVAMALVAVPGSANDWADSDDTTIYKVVVNHEEMYSFMPADRELPLGLFEVGFSGSEQECLDHIAQIWTDMRPLSLRKKMEEMEPGAPTGQTLPPFSMLMTYTSSVAIMHPSGKIEIGVGDIQLHEAVGRELNSGWPSIVFEMSHVTAMDDSGIGELVSSFTRASTRGVAFVLSNVPQNILDKLVLTGLDTVFDIYDSEADAIAALQ